MQIRRNSTPERSLALKLALLVALFFAASAVWSEFRESYTFDSNRLQVANLVGEIQITDARGGVFEVEVRVEGRDGTADNISIQHREGSRSELNVRFPLERQKRYVYPELGRGSTSFRVNDNDGGSWLRRLIGAVSGDNIKVSGRGPGLEVWADITIGVPRGAELELKHGVGAVSVTNVAGDLSLDVHSGTVSARGVDGALTIDTGSGDVKLSAIRGDLTVDTGSGKVSLRDFDGKEVEIDTGSGDVALASVTCDRLVVDTGSGSVRVEEVRAESAEVDTGSGSVVLSFLEMGNGSFDVDTGSGSITLLVPSSVSAEIEADTGSGGIDVELADITIISRERDEIRFRVGQGGARVRLDTGSGRIRIASLD